MAGASGNDTGDRVDDTAPPAGPGGGHEPGGENATVRAAVVSGTVLALATLLVLYFLVQVWPPAPPPAISGGGAPAPTTTGVPDTTTPAGQVPATTVVVQAAPNPPVRLFGATLEVDREARLFIVVALAGALGGLVYALRSLTWYAGNRNLKYSWMMTYYLQPIVGAGLATITYVALRGGLVIATTQASPDVVNPFAFAAFGALVGLFSAQAAEWLKRIFEQVFAPAMKGKDADVETEPAPAGEAAAQPPAGGEAGDGGGEPDLGEPDLGEEQPPEPDPDEHAEAGLSQLTAEQVEELDRQAAAEHGEPQDAEVDDEPVDEHEDALAPLHEADEEDREGGRP
jgi:hypothetical protein